jgi:hypothetical protein
MVYLRGSHCRELLILKMELFDRNRFFAKTNCLLFG